MAKADTEPQFKPDEFSRIFDEYRAKIEEITRRTERKLQSLDAPLEAAVTAGPLAGEDAGSPEETAAPAPPEPADDTSRDEEEDDEAGVIPGLMDEDDEADTIMPSFEPPVLLKRPIVKPGRQDRAKPPPEESAEILYEARKQAKRIIDEAEERVKKEARKKTQSQVDKIIDRAKKEAEDIVARARQSTEKDRNDAITTSKREAEQLIKEITEKARLETQSRSSQAIADAREKAQKIMADIIASSTEISRFITEIVERARKTIGEFETRLQTETGDLAKVIEETQVKLEEIAAAAREEETNPVIANPAKIKEVYKNPTLALHFLGQRTNGKNGNHALFTGQVEMKSSSAVDYQYLKNLKKYLVNNHGVKYLQEYASEKEMSVLFDIKEPLPLLDILRNVPLVEEVITGADDDVCIIFKNPA
ncbi:MAG: hypothetical protein A2137_06005 [Chloroflexi bacterium RBG_16_58_8]|nr:MAG: hypothetical protein A2137_06005 [Chloroflexi bacterium RBG_16_58_8]